MHRVREIEESHTEPGFDPELFGERSSRVSGHEALILAFIGSESAT